MPEGDTIFRTARTLQRAIGGQTVTRFETRAPETHPRRLRYAARRPHRRKVEAHGKWLLDLLLRRSCSAHSHADERQLAHLSSRRNLAARPHPHAHRDRDPAMLAVAFNVPSPSSTPPPRSPAAKASSASVPTCWRRISTRPPPSPTSPPGPISNSDPPCSNQSALAGIGNVLQVRNRLRLRHESVPQSRSLTPLNLSELVATARKFLRANVTGNLRPHAHYRQQRAGGISLGLSSRRRALPPLRHAHTHRQAHQSTRESPSGARSARSRTPLTARMSTPRTAFRRETPPC